MSKVVMIGASGHWQYARDGLQAFKEAAIAGIAPGSEDEDCTQPTAALGLSKGQLFADYRQMLDQIRPDVAIVNPRFYLNGQVLGECMQRGVHCFVEKPITFYLKELKRLRRVQQQTNVQVCSMMAYRYNPAFYELYRQVQAGAIGEPLLITAQKSYRLGRRPEWMHSREFFGGLVLWVGIHAIDWLHWITGGGLETVTALQTTKGNRNHGEMESSALCLYKLANGGQASINMDYLRPGKAPTHGDDRLRVAGEKGLLEIMNDRLVLTTHEHEPGELPLAPPVNIFADFLRQVNGQGLCRISTTDVFEVAETAIKSRMAADREKTIKLT